MSGNFDDNKPIPIVEFTRTEQVEMQKITVLIQQNFSKQHQEIMAISNSDLTTMIRQEKQMYSNLAIAYAVGALASMEKLKKK